MSLHFKINPAIKKYEPEKRLEIKKEGVLHYAIHLSSRVSQFGGAFILLISGVVFSILAVFSTKKKIREYQMKKERVLDLRKFYRMV